jgi:hypothetical protein
MKDIKFQLGATRFTIGHQPPSQPFATRSGYARINGMHFDIFAIGAFGWQLCTLRLRENDIEHPVCINGYLISDVIANPSLVEKKIQ